MAWSLKDRRVPRWRRASTIDVLRALWIIVVFWGELGTFYGSVSWCRWPDRSFRGLDSSNRPTRILIISDPQVLDKKSYPGRPKWLTTLTLFIVDSQLRKSWKAAKRMRPQIVVFLGDMMDGGRYAKNPEEYSAYHKRFQSIFNVKPPTLVYHLPGNHDVGLGSNQAFSSRARERYQAHFGPLNQVLEVANHSLVLIDAPGLVEEDYRRYTAETEFDAWLPTAGGSIEFIQSIAQNPLREPTIMFSHIPLSRPEGAYCGPRREKGTIHRGAGLGYQNMLGRETSQFLLESVRPSLIFSGDDHDACEYTHPFYTSSTQLGVREVTVKSFSMAMGIERPAFQLLSLASPPASPLHAETQCLLPNQLRIYTKTYLPLFVLSLVLLVYLHIFNNRKGNGRPVDVPLVPRSPASKAGFRPPTPTPSFTPSPRLKSSSKRSRSGSPVSASHTPLVDEDAFPHQMSPAIDLYPSTMPDSDLMELYEVLPAPVASSRPTHSRKSSTPSAWFPNTVLGGDAVSSFRAVMTRSLSMLLGRRRKAKDEESSIIVRLLRDVWRAAWPPIFVTLIIWAYLFWT